ncbi:MAG: sodium-dependent transporter [Lachnospiraceae bacterium]|nr:sodium-dependent transporter [Lachnospiraceae bacterium]
MEEKRSSFSSSLGFVVAAAGSAVGLGNIWRFPYLAAKDGGGIFLVVYLILALTFGFTLLVSEVSIGRKTKQAPLTAYGVIHPKWKGLGGVAALVPFMILPYYCIIGGWVLKYCVAFLTGHGLDAAEDGYFTGFITDKISPIIFDVIFLAATVFVIYKGVNKGIEAISKILMPILLVLVIGIAIFSLTIKSPDTGKTGIDGFIVYIVPDVSGMSVKDFLIVIMDAMGQLFYSISVAMGIMVAYGSYFRDDQNLMKSVNQIEIFDTLVAFLAGVMIIPAVYVFMGKEGMTAGPGLMFVAIPKVFAAMGKAGNIVGSIFFVMVLFAALTSSISVLEAVVSSLIDAFDMSRRKATLLEGFIALVLGIIICFGYNYLYFEVKLPNGSTAQILDIFDYISNNILMPIVAIGTCILIGWVVKPKYVIDEATKNGEKFGRKKLYIAMIKVIAPILLFILLLGSLGLYS